MSFNFKCLVKPCKHRRHQQNLQNFVLIEFVHLSDGPFFRLVAGWGGGHNKEFPVNNFINDIKLYRRCVCSYSHAHKMMEMGINKTVYHK